MDYREIARKHLSKVARAITQKLIPYVLSKKPDIVNFILNIYERRKNGFASPSNRDRALIQLIYMMLTKSYRRSQPLCGLSENELSNYLQRQSGNHSALLNYIKNMLQNCSGSNPNMRKEINDCIKKIDTLINEYYNQKKDIKDFIYDLYLLSLRGETKILGPKGRDNFLRDWGFIDRCPIDRHMINFISRTGISWCVLMLKSDSLSEAIVKFSLLQSMLGKKKYYRTMYEIYHGIISYFCKEFLSECKISIPINAENHLELISITLGGAPGIFDVFIWPYCSEAKDNLGICRDKDPPRCRECVINYVCWFSLLRN